MSHILLMPLIWAAHAGQWIRGHVLSPFQLGETAKKITEEEIGVYGVLGYAIFKISRLIIEARPLLQPRWLTARALRAVVLGSALLGSAWLLTCVYVGMLIPIVDLNVSTTGLMLAPLGAWLVLGYVMLAERVRVRRAELEAEGREED